MAELVLQRRRQQGHVNGVRQRKAVLHDKRTLMQAKLPDCRAVQRAQTPNNTGLPDNLKHGIESLSGMSMDNVKVHYNSSKPAQLNAHAYAQGADIHLAPGQEKHLPHEAWHVVQQAQGRVKPTMQLKADIPVNDDAGLEQEADVMGAKASQLVRKPSWRGTFISQKGPQHIFQRVQFSNLGAALGPDKAVAGLTTETVLAITAVPAVFQNPDLAFDGPVNTPRGIKRVAMTAADTRLVFNRAYAYITKKLAENPALAGSLSSPAVSCVRLAIKAVRKANRLSGLIARKHAGGNVADAVITALNNFVLHATIPTVAIQSALDAPKIADLKQLEFNKFLLVALRNIYPAVDGGPSDMWLAEHERMIEGLERRKVIAHRGDGATFDKMGGILPRVEHDHLYQHANENSDASTTKALTSWLALASNLSGIECDVHLTADDIPFVTHASRIHHLLQIENNVPLTALAHTDIRTIHSTAVPARFMTLAAWLNLIGTFVDRKASIIRVLRAFGRDVRFKRLRIEIEMKQVGVLTDAAHPELWKSTNKVVSAFLKNSANSYMIEVAMFNNSAVPPLAHAAAKTKTLLSHVTHAQGGAPDATLSEVRFGMHQKGIATHLLAGRLDHKIVTFAPGLDHPGGVMLSQQLLPVNNLPTSLDVTIEQSIQSARHRHLTTIMEARRAADGTGPVSIHTLTDHGETGAGAIIATGLPVGMSDIPDHWTTDAIRAKHPELTDAVIRNALQLARTHNDPALIGRHLIQVVPALL